MQCILVVGKYCKLDQLIIFSEILTECVGLDVAHLVGDPYKNLCVLESSFSFLITDLIDWFTV